MNKITLKSPAKINLTLDVIKKTESGYHEIRSIIMPIPLHDTIIISKNTQNNISKGASKRFAKNILKNLTFIKTGIASPQKNKNTVCKAVQLFFAATKKNLPHITIHLHKRIPLASGLGGGSSNAATTLLGLNSLFGSPLSRKQLLVIAKKIGMDVPFFLNPVLSIVTHFGEKCTPIKIKNKNFPEKNLPKIKLFFPKTKKISTAHAYAALDLKKCAARTRDTAHFIRLLKTASKSQKSDTSQNTLWNTSWNTLLHNDFAQLYDLKLNHHIAGSGPCYFEIPDQSNAQRAN